MYNKLFTTVVEMPYPKVTIHVINSTMKQQHMKRATIGKLNDKITHIFISDLFNNFKPNLTFKV